MDCRPPSKSFPGTLADLRARLVATILLFSLPGACTQPAPEVTNAPDRTEPAAAKTRQTATQPTMGERIIDVPKRILEGALDPTGVRTASGDIGRASDELAKKLRELDIDAVNATLWQLQETIGIVRSRVQSLPLDLGTDVKTQIQNAQLKDVSDQLQAATGDLRRKIESIRIDQFNDAVAAIGKTVDHIDAKVSELDMTAVNKLVGGTQKSIDRTDDTLATAGMPLRVALWLINAVLGLLLLCMVVWLRKLLRVRA